MNSKHLLTIIVGVLLFASCQKKEYVPRTIESVKIIEYKVDSASIRAIEVLPDSTMIFATDKGFIGIASADKVTTLQQIKYDTITPHFRAIATNGTSSFVLSVENPALLYKITDGKTALVYKEEHEKVFYDAMRFFDDKNGIAVGDPTEDCMSIITTNDGGNTWTKTPCSQLPKIKDGEAFFAASNTNIAVSGKNAWIASGGKHSRIFHSPDKGKTWSVYETPIVSGSQMTGVFSMDFYDNLNGIIIGGDWQNKDKNTENKAITSDGGKTWQLIADGQEPNYKSCIQYVPETNGKELFAVGTTGISFSNDAGKTWKKVSDDSYYTIKFVNKNLAWLAGRNKIGKLILQ